MNQNIDGNTYLQYNEKLMSYNNIDNLIHFVENNNGNILYKKIPLHNLLQSRYQGLPKKELQKIINSDSLLEILENNIDNKERKKYINSKTKKTKTKKRKTKKRKTNRTRQKKKK